MTNVEDVCRALQGVDKIHEQHVQPLAAEVREATGRLIAAAENPLVEKAKQALLELFASWRGDAELAQTSASGIQQVAGEAQEGYVVITGDDERFRRVSGRVGDRACQADYRASSLPSVVDSRQYNLLTDLDNAVRAMREKGAFAAEAAEAVIVQSQAVVELSHMAVARMMGTQAQ